MVNQRQEKSTLSPYYYITVKTLLEKSERPEKINYEAKQKVR